MNKTYNPDNRIQFSKRLRHSVSGYSATSLAAQLGISRQAVTKWLNGEALPNAKRINELANFLNTTPEWLMFGTNEKKDEPEEKHSFTEDSNKHLQAPSWKKVPNIKWSELITLKKIDYEKKIKSGDFSWAGERVGPKSYALVVKDEDMMPRYEPGSLLIIDPDYPLHHKNKVIFLIEGKTPTCKQLIIDGANFYLKSHAPGYDPIKISTGDIYCGSIRQVLMEY